jgi:dUTP pyrophosphatase
MLLIKRLTETSTTPTKANSSDAGFDLYSDEDVIIKSGESVLVSTGVAMAIPENHAGLIWDRSSMGVKGIHRFAGVVDSGYRGEVKVCLFNTGEDYKIVRGDRIEQILIQPVPNIELREVEDLNNTERGIGGFGSSGK